MISEDQERDTSQDIDEAILQTPVKIANMESHEFIVRPEKTNINHHIIEASVDSCDAKTLGDYQESQCKLGK